MGHSPMSGSYTNKHDFELKTLHFLGDKVLTEPLKMYVVNVIGGGGSEDTFAVEMKANADCRNGEILFSFNFSDRSSSWTVLLRTEEREKEERERERVCVCVYCRNCVCSCFRGV